MSDYDHLAGMVSTTPFDVHEFAAQCVTNRVLDIGCGYGRNLERVTRDAGITCYGIDNSLVQLKRVSRRYSKNIAMASALGIPFEDKTFGGAFALGVIDSFLIEQQLLRFFTEVHRVLKPRAPLWMNFYTTNPSFAGKYGKIDPKHPGVILTKSGLNVRHWTPREVTELSSTWFITLNWKVKMFNSMNHTRQVPGIQMQTVSHS